MTPVLSLLTLMVACGGADRVDDVMALTGDAAAGATVYANDCASCHGADGSGDSGPSIIGEDESEEIAEVVLFGEDDMPAFDGDLSDQDIADVVAYVAGGFAAE